MCKPAKTYGSREGILVNTLFKTIILLDIGKNIKNKRINYIINI